MCGQDVHMIGLEKKNVFFLSCEGRIDNSTVNAIIDGLSNFQ